MASDDTNEDREDGSNGPEDVTERDDRETEIAVHIEGDGDGGGPEPESEGDGLGDLPEEDERRIDGVAGVAAEEVDQRIVDLLSWILDTETRAKIYVFLLASPGSTSEEVAKGTGLYPSTVREALAELHEEEKVGRQKRSSEGAGNNPYEYTAIQPSELVGGVVDQVQHELNTIFTLDRVLDRRADGTDEIDDGVEPVTITVDDESDPADLEWADRDESADDSTADTDGSEGTADDSDDDRTGRFDEP